MSWLAAALINCFDKLFSSQGEGDEVSVSMASTLCRYCVIHLFDRKAGANVKLNQRLLEQSRCSNFYSAKDRARPVNFPGT